MKPVAPQLARDRVEIAERERVELEHASLERARAADSAAAALGEAREQRRGDRGREPSPRRAPARSDDARLDRVEQRRLGLYHAARADGGVGRGEYGEHRPKENVAPQPVAAPLLAPLADLDRGRRERLHVRAPKAFGGGAARAERRAVDAHLDEA